MSYSTWENIKPVTHYSSSKKIYEETDNNKLKINAHANFIYDKIKTYDLNLDIILEAKYKDLAVLDYKKKFL